MNDQLTPTALAESKRQHLEVRELAMQILTTHPLGLGPARSLVALDLITHVDRTIEREWATREDAQADELTAHLAVGDQLIPMMREQLEDLRRERAEWEARYMAAGNATDERSAS